MLSNMPKRKTLVLMKQCKYNEKTPKEAWLDTKFAPYGTEAQPSTSMFLGPNFLAKQLYQLSPPQVFLFFIYFILFFVSL